MHVGLLRTALLEYRPSLLVRFCVMGRHMSDTTIADVVSQLMGTPDGERVMLFGATDFILRECNAEFASRNDVLAQPELPFVSNAPNKDYLQIDVRYPS